MYDTFIQFVLRFDKFQGKIFEILDDIYQTGEFNTPSKQSIKNQTNQDEILKTLYLIRDIFKQNGISQKGLDTFNVSCIDDLMTKSFIEKESLNYWIYKKAFEPKIDELFLSLKAMLRDYFISHESFIVENFKKLFKIYCECRNEHLHNESNLTFSEVSLKTKELLSSVDSEFLYYRLDSSIDHILIDEFQDTNILQYEIIKPLIDEIASGYGSTEFKSFFYVGDKKQSIYRFRGGQKELFDFVSQRYNVKIKRLNTNYRSCKNIVKFVNDTFINLIDGYVEQKSNSSNDGYVEVTKCDDVCKSVYDSLVKLLDSGVNANEIAILTFVNDDATKIIEYIHKNDKNLKIYNEAKLLLRDITSIKAIVELLRYIMFKEDIYKIGFLSLISCDIDENIDISEFDISFPLDKLVKLIVSRFNLYNDINILKFISVLDRYDGIEEFIYGYDNFLDEALSQKFDGLRVLTIHKSKGLEFESVILADKIKGKNNTSGTFIQSQESITNVVSHLRISKRASVDTQYGDLIKKEKKLLLEDELNAQYVAFTRAKNNLIICCKEEKSGFGNLRLHQMCLGKILPSSIQLISSVDKMPNRLKEQFYGLQEFSKKPKIKTEDKEAVEFGIAMHYMLEMGGDFSESSLKIAFNALKSRFFLQNSHESFEEIYKRVLDLSNNETFKHIIEGEIHKEVPIVIKNEIKVIDLLSIFEDRIYIVDYKSSQKFHQKHIDQIENYKTGVSKTTDKKIECFLFYLLENGTACKKI